jgi:lincosamide nucleotidyltransferase A/C/D/E
MMNSTDVTELYIKLQQTGIDIYLDGGWGVDALLGKQTRPHEDLDIFIQEKDVFTLRGFLEKKGYKEIKLEIARPFNFVFGDATGREIDVHVFTYDDEGKVFYGPPEKNEVYPATIFDGDGNIDGKTVKCILPEWIVNFHTGYKVRENDYKDVAALCKKYGIEYPEEYANIKKTIG